MRKKRKIHYAGNWAFNIVCRVHHFTYLDYTFNKRRVTCKRCRKTEQYKTGKTIK